MSYILYYILYFVIRDYPCLTKKKTFNFYYRAKIKNIEATEDAKQKLIQERMRKRDNEVSDFVPTNMAANYVQHNRCK